MPFARPPLRDLMRRGSFLAEEVLLGSNARRGSLFASVVKRRTATEASAAEAAIARVHLFSSMMFVIGSVFFVGYHGIPQNWLLHYRLGSAFYIVGCFGYLVAMGMSGSLQDGLSGRLSDAIIILAMVLFILGCALAFTPGGEQHVTQHMDLMNRMYLAGSLLLFFDALKCAVSSRLAEEGLTLGNYLDIATTLSFTVAAVVGGQFYTTTPYVVKEGMAFWLIGSCFCVVGPFRVVACGAYDHDILPRLGDESVYGAMRAAAGHGAHASVGQPVLNPPSLNRSRSPTPVPTSRGVFYPAPIFGHSQQVVNRHTINRSRSPTPVGTPRAVFYPFEHDSQMKRTSSLPDSIFTRHDSSSDGRNLPCNGNAQAGHESSSDGYYSSCEDAAI